MLASFGSIRNNALPLVGTGRVSLRRVLFAASAIIFGLNWTASASASCGSYLHRNGQPVSGHLVSMDSLSSVHAEGISSNEAPLEVPVRRCSGPNCSSNPLPLAPNPVAPVNLFRVVDPAVIPESLTDADSRRDGIQVPQSERGAFFEPSSVFRPPA